MKQLASTLSITGVVSGAIVVLAAWISGFRGPVLTLTLSGLVLMATHWVTFRRIQTGSGKRLGLLIPNAALFATILLGFLYLPRNPASDDHLSLIAIILVSGLLLPLAANVLYLSFGIPQRQ